MLALPLLAACSAPLLDKASDQDANEALGVLGRHGIAAEKHLQHDGSWQVQVDAGSVPAAASLADAYGLPARQRQTLEQLFGKKSFISTPTEEQIRLLIGLNNDVATALEQIDGVLHAEVQIGLPRALQRDSLPMPQAATVLLRHDSSGDLSVSRNAISRFVADAAGGLDPAMVSVILVPVTPDAALITARAAGNGKTSATVWILLAGLLLLCAAAVAFPAPLRNFKPPAWLSRLWRRDPARPVAAAANTPLPPQAGQARRPKAGP
ncbi:MAG TPA: hypothetical protein VM687_04100 [Stenotrophomonas sp.]|nr:hypothetical protein [Stenotrophomonas sp.]